MKASRSLVAASVGITASTVYAQVPVTPPAASPSPAPAPLVPALAPKGTPVPSEKMPEKGQFSEKFKLDSVDDLETDGRKVSLIGHVVFEFRGYKASCDHMVADRLIDVFVLEGNALLTGADATIQGDRLVVDFPNKAFQAFRARADLKPSLVGGQLTGDVFSTDLESHGTQDDFFANTGTITTCDLPNPHYDLDSNDIEIRYGVRAILRRAVLRMFGTKLITLPYLVVPLDDRTYNNLPEVGYDTDEGYYIKTRYGIPLTGNRDLLTHLDYMSSLGLGLGGDYRYKQPDQSGTARVYKILGAWNELTISNDHTQTFKFGTLSLTDDYEQNNYLTDPGETSFNLRGSLSLPQGTKANTLFSFSDSQTSGTGFSSSNDTLGLTDDRKLTPNIHTNVGLNYSGSDSSFGSSSSTQEDLNVKLQVDDNLKKADLGLEYLRDVPIGDNTGFTSGTDIAPEITLTSDAQKLFGNKAAQTFPFHTELLWGDFSNGINGGGAIGATEFDFSFQKPDLSKNKFTVSYQGEFRQGFYSDNTAEYILKFGTDFRYTLGKDTNADLTYSYLRPYGYSPLSIDQTGQTDLLALNATTKPIRNLLTGVQTGFDITQLQTSGEAWQPVSVRNEYSLKNFFALRGLETYDPTQNAWTSVSLDLTYKPGATLLAIGSRFDGVRHTWTSVNITLARLKMGRTQFSTNLAYDGYTQRFDTQQYNVVYDLHCAEAVFSLLNQNTGFRPGNQVQFFIRLKAIPFDGNFGLGTRGQPISTNSGIY